MSWSSARRWTRRERSCPDWSLLNPPERSHPDPRLPPLSNCLGGSREETTMSASSSTTRRRFLAGTSAALAAGAATACGGSRSAPDALTMWAFLDPAGARGREQAVGLHLERTGLATGLRVGA